MTQTTRVPSFREKIILVHVPQERGADDKEEAQEFRALVRSTGGQAVAEVTTSHSATAQAKYFVGSGKAREIAALVEREQSDLVIFNHELTPAQERNLQQLCCCRVLDRSGLILDIFARRALSFEGKLQVELAQLKHLSTRLVRGWTHLERQKGGIGLRGPGETQLETDRRLVRKRIVAIENKLKKARNRRLQGRRSRRRAEIPTVSCVGYTNAGKSTLFNLMTQAQVHAADRLFATLDTTLRTMPVANLGNIILTDTVGFIRNLPHELIAAFRATLEEIKEADLLLHVIDTVDERRRDKIEQVRSVLTDIGAADKPVLKVFNKIDAQPQIVPHIDYDADNMPTRVWLSAQSGQGADLLSQAIGERLGKNFIVCCVSLSHAEHALRARLYQLDAVTEETCDKQGNLRLHLRLSPADYARLIQKKMSATEN